MKYVKQFSIILAISLAGEVLNLLLPLPIPTSVYGLVLLFLCLEAKWIRVSSIRETSTFLIEIMPLMFIPSAVGLIEAWDVLRPSLPAYLAITVISTFAVMALSGRVTERIIRRRENRHE